MEFIYIQNGHSLTCHIEIDTYWRHNKQTGQDYEQEFPVVESILFKGVDISEVCGMDLIDSILDQFNKEQGA